MPQDRVLAALLVLRTVQALGICKMALLTNPENGAELSDRIAALAYQLRMFQDAMLSKELRTRYLSPHTRKPRKKGKGTAAWLADLLTTETRTIDDALQQIAERGGKVEFAELPIELHKPRGGFAKDGRFSNDYSVRYHFGDEWKRVKVKRLREVAKNNAKLRNPGQSHS